MALLVSRAVFCPPTGASLEGLVALRRELEVGCYRPVKISTDNIIEAKEYRSGRRAPWPFLSDVRRIVQKTLDIAEYTCPLLNAMFPSDRSRGRPYHL